MLPPVGESPKRQTPSVGEMVTAVTPDDLERVAAGRGEAFGVHQEVADWPAWFGVRLAQLTTTVDQWRGELFDSDGLQAWLHQELLMSDAGLATPLTNVTLTSRAGRRWLHLRRFHWRCARRSSGVSHPAPPPRRFSPAAPPASPPAGIS